MPQCTKCGNLTIVTTKIKAKEFCDDCLTKREKKQAKKYGWAICCYDANKKKLWVLRSQSLECQWQLRTIFATKEVAKTFSARTREFHPETRIVLVRIRRRVIKKKQKKTQ